MASGNSDRDALSKLLQMSTVAEYQSEFEILINRITGISEDLLKSFYISGLKPLLQCALLRLAPTTLGEACSIARIMEARFEIIAGKKLNIEEKIDIVLSWPSEEAPYAITESLDANEDIGVVEVSSTINDVFDIGESNVESMEVRSEFSEFSENKNSEEEVASYISNSIICISTGSNDYIHYYLRNVSAVESKYVSWEFKKLLAYLMRQEIKNLYNTNVRRMAVMRQQRTWDPGITIVQSNTLRTR